jgi:hypothetical protein
VRDVVAQLDLAPFLRCYRADGHGHPAYDPIMLLGVLLYGYAIGVRSSRQIERRCTEDLAFRVLAGNQLPDHVTIARFRVRHHQAPGRLPGPVLEAVRRRRPAQSGDARRVGTLSVVPVVRVLPGRSPMVGGWAMGEPA